MFVWWFLLKEVRRFPEKAKSGVRRWLTSLTLFVAAVTILGNAITVVYYLVEGELSVRFLLKVAVLFAVAGTIFVYEATPDGYRQVAENQLGDEAFASPAVSGNQMFWRVAKTTDGRRQEFLYCIGTP